MALRFTHLLKPEFARRGVCGAVAAAVGQAFGAAHAALTHELAPLVATHQLCAIRSGTLR